MQFVINKVLVIIKDNQILPLTYGLKEDKRLAM